MFSKFFIISVLLLSNAFSQDVLVKAGHVLDTTTGTWNSNVSFLVKDGFISEINPKKIDKKKVKVLDLSKSYLVPGFLDAHTHLALIDTTNGADFTLGLSQFLKKSSDVTRKRLAEKRARELRRHGFIAVRDLGNSGRDILSLNKNTSALVFSSGPGFTPHRGQFPANALKSDIELEYKLMSEENFNLIPQHKSKVFKIYADENPNATITPLVELKKWVNKAKEQGLIVAVHAITHEAIQNSLQTQADSLEHGTFVTEKQLQQMGEKNVFWVPSVGSAILLNSKFAKLRNDHVENELKMICRNIALAKKYGVKMAFGSDYYFDLELYDVNYVDAIYEAIRFLKSCGLNAKELVQSLTIHPSALVGDKSLGHLEVGALGYFMAFSEDPLTVALTHKKAKIYDLTH